MVNVQINMRHCASALHPSEEPSLARPSIKAQRSEQIVDAFARCISQYGLHGASLDLIAGEAGVTRQALRHFVGNRDDLVISLAEHFLVRSRADIQSSRDDLPAQGRVAALLEGFFSDGDEDPIEEAVGDALLSEARRLNEVRRTIATWFEIWIDFIAEELRGEYPDATAPDVRAAAMTIMNARIVGDALRPAIDWNGYRREAHRGAKRMVDSLAG